MTAATPPATDPGEPDHRTDSAVTVVTTRPTWDLHKPIEDAAINTGSTAAPGRTRYSEYRAGTVTAHDTTGALADPEKNPIEFALQRIAARQGARSGVAAAPARPDWAQGLEDWWVNTATHDIDNSIGKVVEYGGRGSAYDLLATGHDLAAMNGRAVGDEEAAELAILFYLSSKVNRWLAAAIDGRRPSDDTLLDIVYYGMMARRNRAVGGWPVAPAGGNGAA